VCVNYVLCLIDLQNNPELISCLDKKAIESMRNKKKKSDQAHNIIIFHFIFNDIAKVICHVRFKCYIAIVVPIVHIPMHPIHSNSHHFP